MPKIAAEQSSATSNDTTNVQQPTAEAEKSAQEQPVVSPETTIEPLGQPTEVAPAKMTLINQRQFLKI